MSTTLVGILGFLTIVAIVVTLFQSRTTPAIAFIVFPMILAVILVIGGYYDNDTRAGAWMTRTLCNSHSEEDMVVYITSEGEVFDYFTYASMFIRPAVWVSTAG